jgi:hypothetical protein
MATTIPHFVSFEMRLIDTPRRVGFLAAVWHWAPVTVVRMEGIVHVTVESAGPMKPRTSADEDAASKPLRAVVANWSTVIRRNVVVAIGTLWCNSNVNAHLSVCSWGNYHEATSSNGG